MFPMFHTGYGFCEFSWLGIEPNKHHINYQDFRFLLDQDQNYWIFGLLYPISLMSMLECLVIEFATMRKN